ncbi:unnamed protein product, partial [Iphiclides podalirius]
MLILTGFVFATLTFLITMTPSTGLNHETKTASADSEDPFTKMIQSLIKVNEQRLSSLQRYIDLNSFYKENAALLLRKGLNAKNPKSVKIYERAMVDSEDIGKFLAGAKETHDIVVLKNLDLNGKAIDSVTGRKNNVLTVKTNQKNGNDEINQRGKNYLYDESSFETGCDNPYKEECGNKGGCRRGCRRACFSSFRNFCLVYSCSYSMRAKFEKNCRRSCSYRFRY